MVDIIIGADIIATGGEKRETIVTKVRTLNLVLLIVFVILCEINMDEELTRF